MNKYFILLLIASGLCYACSNEQEMVGHETVIQEGITLGYTIPSYKADVYSVEPSNQEMSIKSVFYIFMAGATAESEQVVATSFRGGLTITGRKGLLPLVLPDKGLPQEYDNYTVKVVANWESYLPNGVTSVEGLLSTLIGRSKVDIETNLESTGSLGGMTRLPIYEVPLLFTGGFSYKKGSNNVNITLDRKVTVMDISVNLPENMSIKKFELKNMLKGTNLFNNDKLSGGGVQTISSIPFTPTGTASNVSRFRIYILPNLGGEIMNLELTANVSTVTYDVSGKVLEFVTETEEKTHSFPLTVEHLNSVFFANQYVSMNIFESISTSGVLEYDINGWSSLPFEGVYRRDDLGNGAGVSPVELDFEFSDLSLTPLDKKLVVPSGAHKREVFVSFHGVYSDWAIDTEGMGDWISVTKNPLRSSVIVEVQPNFSVDQLGRIYSAARSSGFKIILNELSGVGTSSIPVTIHQAVAPTIPSEVSLGDKLTLSDKYKGATSSNYFSNGGGSTATRVGDDAAKGVYQSISDEAIYTTWCGTGYRLMTVREALDYLFPRVRAIEMSIVASRAPYLVYYVSDGEHITFLNNSGNGDYSSDSHFSDVPSLTFSLDARDTGLEFAQPNSAPNAPGPPFQAWKNVVIYYGVRMAQTVEITSFKIDVILKYSVRCVKQKI